MHPIVKKTIRILFFSSLFIVFASIIFWLGLGIFSNPLDEKKQWDWSVKVTDRQDRLLKEFLTPEQARRDHIPLEQISPVLVQAVLAAEDKRFYRHPGIDPLALARAAWLNWRHNKIISGGSTISMQLARLNQGLAPGPRTYKRKIREIWWALLIERHNSKERILTEYLNRAPAGNLTEGFPAAAKLYLNKNISELSYSEAAFLAGLPASPGALNPYKNPRPALERRKIILKRMAQLNFIAQDALERAVDEPLDLQQNKQPFSAPHFVSYVRNRHFGEKPPAVIKTTLDLSLQTEVEKIVEETVALYKVQGLSQASVIVMSLPRREILAWVGSTDFFDDNEGQNDGVQALRQPGSALKPFLYAAAFDKKIISPATLIDDRPTDYRVPNGSFSPSNYSGSFHGPVSAEVALASSLNLPAIKLIEELGVDDMLDLLRRAGLNSLDQTAGHYGLGLILGGGEVSLLNLAGAYAAIADQGKWHSARFVLQEEPDDANAGPSVFSPGAAFIVSEILRNNEARATGFGFESIISTPYRASVKTGTSKNFKDNWCLGYTDDFVVGVWAGNFQADPMAKVSGITGAGLIWRRVSDLMAEKIPPKQQHAPPAGIESRLFCPVSGLPFSPQCPNTVRHWVAADFKAPQCPHLALESGKLTPELKIIGLKRDFGLIKPQNGELYAYDPSISADFQHIKAQGQSIPEVDEVRWLLNGIEVERQKVSNFQRPSVMLPVQQAGEMRLEMIGISKGKAIKTSVVNFKVKN